MDMLYYDVYDKEDKWIGFADMQWLAAKMAFESDGYYIERYEDFELHY